MDPFEAYNQLCGVESHGVFPESPYDKRLLDARGSHRALGVGATATPSLLDQSNTSSLRAILQTCEKFSAFSEL